MQDKNKKADELAIELAKLLKELEAKLGHDELSRQIKIISDNSPFQITEDEKARFELIFSALMSNPFNN